VIANPNIVAAQSLLKVANNKGRVRIYFFGWNQTINRGGFMLGLFLPLAAFETLSLARMLVVPVAYSVYWPNNGDWIIVPRTLPRASPQTRTGAISILERSESSQVNTKATDNIRCTRAARYENPNLMSSFVNLQ
jgi:hypothetical protein